MNEFLEALGKEISEKVPTTTVYIGHPDVISICYNGWNILTIAIEETKLTLYAPRDAIFNNFKFDVADPGFNPELVIQIVQKCIVHYNTHWRPRRD